MTATQTPAPAPRKNRRLLKIVGGALAVLFALGLVGSCAKPAADTSVPTQAPVAVVATTTPTARPTDVPKPTAVPPTQAPQPTAALAKPTQPPAPTTAPVKAAATTAAVAATGGDCPADHPIKGNAGSKIYHVRGGASYARTDAEQCFDTPASAQAAGYRAAAR